MKLKLFIGLLVFFYLLSYGIIRMGSQEIWDKDGKTYVIFPNKIVYYVFRPLSLIDGSLTNMNFHIGPHK